VVAHVSAPMPNLKSSIPYPSRRNDERCREKVNDQIEKFYEIFKDLSFEISLTDALILMPKFASTLKTLIGNKEKSRMDECLAFADLGASINLMPLSVWKMLSLPELTPTCMTLKLADRSITKPIGIAEDVYLKVGKRSFLKTGRTLIDVYEGELTFRVRKEAVTFNLDQTSRYSSNYDDMTANRIDVVEKAYNDKSQVDEPPEVELKDLPPHLKYTFLEGDNKLPIIISKYLSVEEKAALIKVLKLHKRAIAWKLSDIKGTNPEFYTHKILMEEDYKPAVQHQRQVNPKIHDVIKKEVEKLLDAGLIYLRSRTLHKMLQRCGDTNLCLNWEKSHFMFKEGIVLGHKISKKGIEVDKAKIDVIAKLPHPTTVKGVQSFLGHADWDLPFELMCNASDFAIGAVLGQRHEKTL
ncbi:reverse transcriptase domain-containing protein, partial [Tanacetum coccineum]